MHNPRKRRRTVAPQDLQLDNKETITASTRYTHFQAAMYANRAPRVDILNALPPSTYFETILPQTSITLDLSDGRTPNADDPDAKRAIHLERKSAADMTHGDITQCLTLVAETSSHDYAKSSMGWSVSRKRKEMRLPDLRYVLLKPLRRLGKGDQDENEDEDDVEVRNGASHKEAGTQEDEGEILGFMSFMITYEDGREVIYLYEIHLVERLRGRGVGAKLLKMFEDAGRAAQVQKAMMTVFRANGGALRLYEKLGYREDEYSPRPKKLRGGIVREADYVIWSKNLKRKSQGEAVMGKKRKAR